MENAGKYAYVIVDISTEKLDRPFQYCIPERLRGMVSEGMEVRIPFGSADKQRKGYVVEVSDRSEYAEDKLKEICEVVQNAVSIEGRILTLASWMKHHYGATMITAMRTVLPVKKKIKEKNYKLIVRTADTEELRQQIESLNPVRYAARIRLYEALLSAESLPGNLVTGKLNISDSVLTTACKGGFIRIDTVREYRNPVARKESGGGKVLSEEQQQVVDALCEEMKKEQPKPALIRGITGSGKTEVYMELIAAAIAKGKQAIMLIPEIALTFQTLMRFYARFGDRVSVLHSRLSEGERYDQYERARNGELDIIIGPRSALFTPFPNPGIIIIDEEHETSYKSEKMPKYHAREVAEYLASQLGAMLVMGSATPSLESYYRAKTGRYDLFTLNNRFGGARLPEVIIADMRQELKAGNKSYFSRKLKELLTERIYKGEQSMLFINRRGTAGFVSCRSCGYVVKCPHCDVSMTEHRGNMVQCHYCGHTEVKTALCPKCGSKYFTGFRAGTEKIEDAIHKEYPEVRVLRMDADTTKNKEDYERILAAFADGEADILVGTQMIVKGHDFPNVTLVGAIAADMSLGVSDYHAAERTFQLLAQAAGRAGRAKKPGKVVIQTYQPEHYSILCAAAQDYESFYEQEIGFRELADYPPVSHILVIQFYSLDAAAGMQRAQAVAGQIRRGSREDTMVLGPAEAMISKLRDYYRIGLYIRHAEEEVLIAAKDMAEAYAASLLAKGTSGPEVIMQFDFDPMSGF